MGKERFEIRAEEMLNNTEDGVFSLDREWRFFHINKKAAGASGLAFP